MVAQVITMQQHTTNHIYSVDDGTGRVEARHWVGTTGNTEAELEKWSGIESVFLISPSNDILILFQREGIYVRLSGFMKSFGNKKYINASHMRPVTDPNEIYFHMLECITVALTLERGPVGVLQFIVTFKATHGLGNISSRPAPELANERL